MGKFKKYYNDIDIGDEFITDSRQVTREEIIKFAQEFDPQPMHLTDDSAPEYFDGIIASGYHTIALATRLVVDCDIFAGTPLLGSGIDKVRWLAPLKPDDEIWAKATIKNKYLSPTRHNLGFITIKVKTYSKPEQLILIKECKVAVPLQPPS
ncbi:MaoC/PaaZ C-terminal domain-containing protein [Piscirickettsia litoralis]|uniref:MaoC-like domain-containing protein n=1 Tax=Piscirickettsia litoralis TaxID=1891921 RepID=A0ABX3A1T3_9GAMM|nr:MaoC/PaaZ C-terminal domain-containing protein [Piscirickettsia litoralis]ODN42187.1 hypothetical protein BGC07_03555 [Piscirickettsia litoralis]